MLGCAILTAERATEELALFAGRCAHRATKTILRHALNTSSGGISRARMVEELALFLTLARTICN